MSQRDRRRLHRLALAVSIVAIVLPVLATPYLPFTDAPEHAAVMATLARWGDPVFSAPFDLALHRSQYLAYHVSGAVLARVVGDAELASRLLLALAGAGFPLAFRALLRAAGRDERLALFGCLPFWCRPLVIGFLPFVASIPLALLALAGVFRLVRGRATLRRRAALAALAVLLFYTHLSTWMLFVASAVAVAFVARRPRELLALAPSAVLAAGWLVFGRLGLHGDSIAGTGEISRIGTFRAVLAMPSWVFDVWRSRGDDVAALAWWSGFLVVAVTSARTMARHARGAIALLYAPLACAACIYLLTPFRVGAALMLNVRLAPVLVLLAFLPVRWPRGQALSRVVTGLALGANLVGGAAAFAACRSARHELGDVDAVLAMLPPGGRLLTLNFDIRNRTTHIYPWAHVGAYHRVRSGGVASFSFSELRHWPVQYRPEMRPPPKPGTTWDYAPCLFRNAVDGAYYDHVLVRGDVDPFAREPPGPIFERVLTTGTLSLYRRAAGRWPEGDAADPGPCAPSP